MWKQTFLSVIALAASSCGKVKDENGSGIPCDVATPEGESCSCDAGEFIACNDQVAVFCNESADGITSQSCGAAGCNADMVLLQAADPIEAIRLKARRLAVIRRGKVIAELPAQVTKLKLDGRPPTIDAASYQPKSA